MLREVVQRRDIHGRGVGELSLIDTIRARAGAGRGLTKSGRGPVRLGIGDDCAVLRPPRGHDILVTTDFSLEGRHFRRDWHPARSVGHRCLARGLSDLAAMGAKPMAAFLSLALPAGFWQKAAGRRWMDGFFSGLNALAGQHGVPLAGGDTSTAPGEAILADIVLLGSAPRRTELRRSGAKAGDALYVTGALGGAAVELAALSAAPRRFARARADGTHPHLFPEPRLAAGAALRRRKMATAAIDLSDGLSTDLRHLCEESGVGAVVDAAALPLGGSLRDALHGGEDYELLFTARPGTRVPRALGGVAVTRIGEITRSRTVLLREGDRTTTLLPGGWEHSL